LKIQLLANHLKPLTELCGLLGSVNRSSLFWVPVQVVWNSMACRIPATHCRSLVVSCFLLYNYF